MDNHYHLLVETPEGNLSIGMRQINGIYTRRFNRRHEKSGHLFQGRFKSVLVERDSYLLEVNRYISLNPVRSGVISDPAKYAWSSFPAMIGIQTVPTFLSREWVLSQFDSCEDSAMSKYREFVYEGITQSKPIEYSNETVLGSAQFKKGLQMLFRKSVTLREIPRIQRYANRPALRDVLSPMTIQDKSARNAAIRACALKYGYSLTEIGHHLGLHYTTISKIVNQGN
jgi:hypothetical protein